MKVQIDCSRSCVNDICQWVEDAQVWLDERIAEGMTPINMGRISCRELLAEYDLGLVCNAYFESPEVGQVDKTDGTLRFVSFRQPPIPR
jgi:hypothetical protein